MTANDAHYDLVVIGSGFGSSYFLHKLLSRSSGIKRILVLERGRSNSHHWQTSNGSNSNVDVSTTISIPAGHKPWKFTIGFGGGTNCWWGITQRMHPSDFEVYSRYGVGRDWPISYTDLEPYYVAAERIMSVSGDDDSAVMFPRSAPYPQPPHRLATPDRIMKRAYPGQHFAVPAARARIPTLQRAACCAHGNCNLCPIDAKFTVLNEMMATYRDPRLTLKLEAEVVELGARNGMITEVEFIHSGSRHVARADLFVLGANAIFSPFILQRSGLITDLTGKGLNEQVSVDVEVFLDGVGNFDGSSAHSAFNYALFDGEHRRNAAAATVLFRNRWARGLRHEYGRWTELLSLLITVEDPPRRTNCVSLTEQEGIPLVAHASISDYARNGIDRALAKLPELLAPLPVERIGDVIWRRTESHLQGTMPMGNDPASAEVDHRLVHHKYRNLVVVGSSVFPSCPTANPSLTVAALALRAADGIF